MAKKKSTSSRDAEAPKAPEFPKTLVRVTKAPGGGYSVEDTIAADAEAEASALENGFQPVADVVTEPEPVEYPKWLYHKKHGGRIVQSEAEAEKLGAGWEDKPIVPEEPEPVGIAEPEPEGGR